MGNTNSNNKSSSGGSAPPPTGKSQPPPPPPPAPKPSGGGAGGGGSGGTTVASVQSMEKTMETIDRKQALLEQKITEQEEKAKAYMAANKKPMALNCMKLKKQYEDQIEKLHAQRMNLQTTQFALETAEMNRVVMQEQSRAGSELARVNAQMNPDLVQDVMDQVQQQIQDVKAANDALAQPIDMEMADDDEAEDALKALMKTDAQQNKAAATSQPATAVKQKSAADKQAEEELARLMGGVNVPTGQVKDPNQKVDASKSAEQSEEEKLLAQLQLG